MSGQKHRDVAPTDHIFIRLLESYEYIEHFELSVPDKIQFQWSAWDGALKVTDRVTTRDSF